MTDELLSEDITRSDKFYGQFICTASQNSLPQGWLLHQRGIWNLAVNRLPVLEVVNIQGSSLGWCLGYPILDGRLETQRVVIACFGNEVSDDAIDDFYQKASGKWLLLLTESCHPKVYLDTYGSLSAVYSVIEPTIASTATLLGAGHPWNDELIKAMGLPQHDAFLLAGLTCKKHVSRLLPNHSLDLLSWKTERHWPRPDTDLSEDGNTEKAVDLITQNIQSTISAVAANHPLCFSLTAGMDSRMLLACARNHVQQAQFFTFTLSKGSIDDTISELLAKKFQLNHKFFPTLHANEEEAMQWLARTGYCMSGSIWKVHKSLYKLDPERVLLPGTAGEIGRRILLWRPEDSIDTPLTAQRIFNRYKIPNHPDVLRNTNEWLAGIQQWDPITQIYLVFIEQRLGCWAAPQHYGNNHSIFECSPFNSRKIFHASLRLPVAYRKQKLLPADLINKAWPELMAFPFNEYPGVKGYVNARVRRFKSFVKGIIVKT